MDLDSDTPFDQDRFSFRCFVAKKLKSFAVMRQLFHCVFAAVKGKAFMQTTYQHSVFRIKNVGFRGIMLS